MPISFDNVFYTYSKKTPFEYNALKDISLNINDGDFTFIVGRTGCGKSTLIQQINALLVPTSGEVKVNDFVINPKNKKALKKVHDLRKEVGIVFQFSENQLFDETVEEDVAFGPMNFGVKKEEAIEIAHKYLKLVGINESYFKKSPFELSGGEKRRVAIAGILAIEPKILILDEPNAGLDPKGTEEILSILKQFNNEGKTIIIVSHDINLVYRYGKQVVVMDNGQIAKVTTPHDLFNEDVERFSLEEPMLQKTVNMLMAKGMNLDTSKIHSIEELAKEIAGILK